MTRSSLLTTWSRYRNVLVACSIWLCTARVAAHGGPPSVVGVVAARANEPTLVLLNEGLALHRSAHWTFLCPSLWGNTSSTVAKVPLALSADGESSWIIGEDDLYRETAGVFTAQGRSDLDSSHVELLAGDARGVFALVLTSSGTDIVQLDAAPPRVVWSSTAYWSSLVFDGDQLAVARITDDETTLVLATVSLEGALTHTREIPRAFRADASVDLRPTPRALFASMFDGTEHSLVAIEQTQLRMVLRSATPIHGPIASADGSLWVVADEQLLHAVGDSFAPTSETRRVSCLERWGAALPYACVTGELYALTDAGLGAQLFALQTFEGPEPALVTDAARQTCGFQWVLYKNDLTLGGYAPIDAEPPAATGPAAGAGGGSAMTAAAQATPAAGASAPPAVVSAAEPASTEPAAHGCSVGPATIHGGRDIALALCIATATLTLLRARRRRARTRSV